MIRYADLDSLVRHVRGALRMCLRAVLEDDVTTAEEVLATTEVRRRLTLAAQETLRARSWVPAPQLVDELRFVAEFAAVSEMVDQLAARVVADDLHAALPPSDRLEVALLLDAGDRYICRVLGCEPPAGRSHGACASALFEVAEHGSSYGSPTVRCCGTLATGLLRASRLAPAVS